LVKNIAYKQNRNHLSTVPAFLSAPGTFLFVLFPENTLKSFNRPTGSHNMKTNLLVSLDVYRRCCVRLV
jgi:hypothetical protein